MEPPAIRPATAADAPFLAWVMQEADRMGGVVSSTDLVFDFGEKRRLDFLARLAVSDADSYYHYRRFLIAEVDGEPAAALAGYVPDELPPDSFIAVVREEGARAGWTDSELMEVLSRDHYFSSHYFRVAIPGDSLRVEWVATRPEFRRRGLIAALLQRLLFHGRQRGLRNAYVGTAIGNEPAQRAYESAGFEVFAECRHVDFEAIHAAPGLVFLRRQL